MDKLTLFKEAVKTSLSLALVYWLGLRLGWMNPYWAGWAVAMIAIPAAAGASLHKGMLRVLGTIPGCIGALVIYYIAGTDRWIFMILTCGWVSFNTYMMLIDKKRSYFWNVAGFVALIILLTGPSDSNSLFQHAMFRTIETAMGVVIYTLVALFIWPASNLSQVKGSAVALITAQLQVLKSAQTSMLGGRLEQPLPDLQKQVVQATGAFDNVLTIEGSESFKVQEVLKYWEQFQGLSAKLMEVMDRWVLTLEDLDKSAVTKVMIGLENYFTEVNARMDGIQQLLNGKETNSSSGKERLSIDKDHLKELSHLQKAAFTITLSEMKEIDNLLLKLEQVTLYLCDENARKVAAEDVGTKASKIPTFDLDHLRGALFAGTAVAIGFMIWIFFNPVGHAGWFQFTGSLAMAVAGTQQLRATVFIKPVGIASVIALLAYIFIMPQLSTFLELGTLIFCSMFIACFFFKGLAQVAGIIGILNNISVQNEQVYNFAAMANSFVFTLIGFAFVYALSYMLSSPRPEKMVISLVRRFFRIAGYLIGTYRLGGGQKAGIADQLRTAFFEREIKFLPNKIMAWGSMIDPGLFPKDSKEQIGKLVVNLQSLVYRVEELRETHDKELDDMLYEEVKDVISQWQNGIEKVFASWSSKPHTDLSGELSSGLLELQQGLEKWIEELYSKAHLKGLGDKEGVRFFQIIGGFKGISQAAASYAQVAQSVSWKDWKEEKFS